MLSMQTTFRSATLAATAAATTAGAALFMGVRPCLPGVPPFRRKQLPSGVKR
jgi:hypothetical protein